MAKIIPINREKEASFPENPGKLLDLLNSLPVYIAYFDKEQRYQFNNKAYEELLGRSLDEIKGKHVREVIGKKAYESILPNVEKALSGQSASYYFEILLEDGRKKTFETDLMPHLDANGDVVGCYVHAKDITERKKTEDDLKMMQYSVDHAMDRVVWVAPDGHMLYLNEKAREESGYSLEEARSLTISDIGPDFTPETWREFYKEVKKKGSMRFETRAINKDGQIQALDVDASHLEFGGKEFICSYVRDITERKEVEDKMAMMQFSIEHAQDRIGWIDKDGQFIYVNEVTWKEMGYTREEMLSKKVSDLNPNFTQEIWYEHFKKMKKAVHMSIESQHISKDGELHDMEISTNYLEFGGKEFLCSFGRDITERKKADDELKNAYHEIKMLKERLEMENVYLREQISVQSAHENIIGTSDAIKYILYKIKQVAPSDTTVLILGETGTGKDLVAEAIHSESSRRKRNLVKVNCAALPSNLIESELFGREKGAYTGSNQQIGRFELANKGTIFLDEIGEFPLELQAKLLKVLQSGEFEHLGSPHTISTDVRVIASTNRDMLKEVKEGRFREDLFYRLNVFPITVPPLRDRVEDIPLIVDYILKKFGKRIGKKIESVPRNVMKTFENYSWPGNVRELENIIERSMIISPGSVLHLADKLETSEPEIGSTSKSNSLLEIEHAHILQVLEQARWKIEGKNGAAEMLEINPSTLRTRMRKLGIQKPVQ